MSSSESSNDGTASHTEVAGTRVAGRTASQVHKAIGTIRFSVLDATESSSGGIPSHGGRTDLEGLGDALATPQVNVGE